MIWWMLQDFIVTAVLAGCVWMICRIARPSPAMQHALWLVLLIKLVTPPVFPWPWAVEDLIARAGLRETIVGNSFIAAQPGVVSRETAMKSKNVVAGKENGAPIPAGEFLLLVVASVWLTGSGLFVFVQTEKVRGVLALLKGARPASSELQSLVEDVAGHLKTRAIAARIASTIVSPFIWCIRRPLLLWPEALPLVDKSVRGLLVHELAHVKRRDHWVGWLELAAGCLWWWNPLYWCIRRQLRENAELACDAWVVSSIESAPNGRRAYAETLVSVCESMSEESRRSSAILAMGVGTGDRRFLERRLTMILREHRPFRLSRVGIAFVALIFAGTLPVWTFRAAPQRATLTSTHQGLRPEAPSEEIVQSENPQGKVSVGSQNVRKNSVDAISIPFSGAVSGIGRSFITQRLTGQTLELQGAVFANTTEIELDVSTGEILGLRTPDRTFNYDLTAYRNLRGETIHLHLRGATQGMLWGTDVYTDDSDPNAAVVHAGILRPGEEGIAAIRLLPGMESYQGTTRNGIQSNAFGRPFGGSYRFEGVQPVARPAEATMRLQIPFIIILDGAGGDSASSELMRMRDQIGATVDLTVTGSNSAPIWGDGIYTDDSAVAVAAVHAGLLRVGEIGVVRATIMPPQDRYEGTTRNGIQSRSFGRFEGSYRLERVK
jgi:beta-lactamase regulating signal transducer with metallopeptidase domain